MVMSKDITLQQLSQYQSRAHVLYQERLNIIERNSYIIMVLVTGYTVLILTFILG